MPSYIVIKGYWKNSSRDTMSVSLRDSHGTGGIGASLLKKVRSARMVLKSLKPSFHEFLAETLTVVTLPAYQ